MSKMASQKITTDGWDRQMYRIWDRSKGVWFHTRNSKHIWHTPGAAKNAWNLEQQYQRDRSTKKFNEQDRFEIVSGTWVPCI